MANRENQEGHRGNAEHQGGKSAEKSGSTRGGTSEQHAEAGRQSHKNDGTSGKGDSSKGGSKKQA